MFLVSFKYIFDLIKFKANNNSITSIGILTRLDYPSIVFVHTVLIIFRCFVQAVELL
jgi:hypothetical protein